MRPEMLASLYRFRPLSDAVADPSIGLTLLDRELSALTESYLYAPSFSDMNDPMEAFYEFDGSLDILLNAIMPGIASFAQDQLRQMIDRCGLVSFSDTADNLLLWGYYAQGFRGMCLEFDPSVLGRLSRFKDEPLFPVTYADLPAPALPTGSIIDLSIKDAVIQLLCRKRIEWSHEREWRFLAGQVGKRHYVDDALQRIYFGPLTSDNHIARICEAMRCRPVEILKGRIVGYDLDFDVIQRACALAECERVGKVEVDLDSLEIERDEIQSFLEVPIEHLRTKCAQLADHPNIHYISSVHVTGDKQDRVVICAAYHLRNGSTIYHNLYFDKCMNPMVDPYEGA